MAQPSEFWVVGIPVDASSGASLRLLDVRPTVDEAKQAVMDLPADITGRVAVLQRATMYAREMAVTTTETEAVVKGKRSEEEA
jgi:hypothetical protein